jgi:hypothetical protein
MAQMKAIQHEREMTQLFIVELEKEIADLKLRIEEMRGMLHALQLESQ